MVASPSPTISRPGDHSSFSPPAQSAILFLVLFVPLAVVHHACVVVPSPCAPSAVARRHPLVRVQGQQVNVGISVSD